MNHSARFMLLAALTAPLAAPAIGCSPPGAVDERAAMDLLDRPSGRAARPGEGRKRAPRMTFIGNIGA
jgi:hypothetical protein